MNPRRLAQLADRWRWQLGARDALFALGAAGLTATMTLPWVITWPWLAATAFLATLAAKLAYSRPWTLDAARIARHLDRTYPDLEESSVLWLRPPERLTLLERLQLKRIDTALNWVIPDDPPPGEPPRGFLRPALWCGLGGLMMCSVVSLWTFSRPVVRPTLAPTHAAAVVHPAPGWPRILGGGLTITPPAYTGRPARRVDNFNAEIEEGARVTWTFGLDQPVRGARLVFGGNELPLRAFGERDLGLTAERVVGDPELYHLAATLPDGRAWNPPELYSLKVIKDHAPTVRVLQPATPRTTVEPATPAPRVTVEVLAGDDYGIADAHLVATVAKGNGEAVKFREQVLSFDTDVPADADGLPHGRRLTRVLDLGALGMEPGDELYFFVEARDHHPPAANRTRSETRFVTLRGPEQRASTAGRGVAGINLVPVYFRSERQIIIDTEKLLADRPGISDAEYRQRANDLGLDQQLLRLRYGQFLGEEMENGAVADHAEINLTPLQATPPESTGPRAAASVAQRFIQEHAAQDHGDNPDADAAPRAAPEKPLAANDVRRPFVDSHDTQDAATLFDRETKGTLKDVLAAMWEAEGRLRTVRVSDALAPEHRALDVLKLLQQSDRAYVQHVGFEATPLKIDERRLKGDAAAAPALVSDRDALPTADPSLGTVRAALAAFPSPDTLRAVEPVLTAAATRQPETFLDGLQILRRVTAGEAVTNDGALRPLERALWRLLPVSTELPARGSESAPGTAEAYARALHEGEGRR